MLIQKQDGLCWYVRHDSGPVREVEYCSSLGRRRDVRHRLQLAAGAAATVRRMLEQLPWQADSRTAAGRAARGACGGLHLLVQFLQWGVEVGRESL